MRHFTTGCGLAVALCLMLGTGRAQAQILINIDTGAQGTFIASLPGPYASGTLTQAGSNVTVEVMADNTPLPISQSPVATISEFAFNAPVGTSVTPPTGWSSSTSQSLDSFGSFNQAVSGTAAQSISFTVNGVSTSDFAKSSGVLVGYQFAVIWIANGGVGGGDAAGNAVPLAVPEPGPLLGAGVVTLMGLGYTWRRRRQATA